MQRSTGRILTTHTGSLPRPAALVQMVEGHDQREVRTQPGFTSQVHAAVAEVVRKQADVGIDVLSDGEMSKVAFSAYVTERVTGFDGPPRPPAPHIEPRLFPEYYQSLPPVGPVSGRATALSPGGVMPTSSRTSRPCRLPSRGFPDRGVPARRITRPDLVQFPQRLLSYGRGIHLRGRRRAEARVPGDRRGWLPPPAR